MARDHDGRLVCGYRFRKQADTDRPTLGRLASFSILAVLQRLRVGDGLRSLDSIKAFEESDAGNLELALPVLDWSWVLGFVLVTLVELSTAKERVT
jgi:hypothetical protein